MARSGRRGGLRSRVPRGWTSVGLIAPDGPPSGVGSRWFEGSPEFGRSRGPVLDDPRTSAAPHSARPADPARAAGETDRHPQRDGAAGGDIDPDHDPWVLGPGRRLGRVVVPVFDFTALISPSSRSTLRSDRGSPRRRWSGRSGSTSPSFSSPPGRDGLRPPDAVVLFVTLPSAASFEELHRVGERIEGVIDVETLTMVRMHSFPEWFDRQLEALMPPRARSTVPAARRTRVDRPPSGPSFALRPPEFMYNMRPTWAEGPCQTFSIACRSSLPPRSRRDGTSSP